MDQLKSNIFNFAYEMALRDATLQGAYSGKDKKILRKNERAKSIVRNYIDEIFEGNQPCFYPVEESVERSFREFIKSKNLKGSKDDAVFTFGNAQKLINMTAKYMYIAAYQNDSLRENFKCCHCPMDIVMVKTVIEKIKNMESGDKSLDLMDIKADMDAKWTNRTGGSSCWSAYLNQSWSGITTETKQQYELFQKLVRFLCGDNLSPIEFDFKYWTPNAD